MNDKFPILILLCIFLSSPLVKGEEGHPGPMGGGLSLIYSDFEKGRLDEREKRLYLFYYISKDERLPKRYGPAKGEGGIQPFACLTNIVREIREEPSPLSSSEREEVENWLADLVKRGGETGKGDETRSRQEKVPCGRTSYNHYESENFVVEWSESTGASESYAEALSGYLETSWSVFIDEEGYSEPILADRYLYRVYIENLGWQGGLTSSSDPACPEMACTYIDTSVFNDLFFQQDVAAHEFYHALQFAYNTLYESGWFWEASAVWSEDLVFPENNIYTWYISYYTETPYERIDYEDGSREYGMCIYAKYLEEYQGGKDILRELWEVSEDDYSATLDANVERVLSPVTFEDTVMEFTAVSATMDYLEGMMYGKVTTSAQHGYYPVVEGTVEENRPRSYGSNFIFFQAIDIEPPFTRFNISFEGDSIYNGTPIQWGAYLSKVEEHDERNAVRVEIPLEDGIRGEAGFNQFGVKIYSVYLTVTLLTDVPVTEEGPSYTYSVELTEEGPGEEEEAGGGCGGGYPGDPDMGTPGGCLMSHSPGERPSPFSFPHIILLLLSALILVPLCKTWVERSSVQ